MAENEAILEIIEDMTEEEETAPVAEEEPSEEPDTEQEEPQPDEAEEEPERQEEPDDNMTRGVARRIKQVREEAFKNGREEGRREAIAEYERSRKYLAERRGYKSVEHMDAEDFKDAVKNAESPEEIAEIRRKEIDRDPEVQAAREQMNKNYRQAQLAEIHKLDPSINSMDDLVAMENFDEFDYLAKKGGMTMVQAFKVAAFDRLQAKRAEAARQAAVNAAKSKSHLKSTSAGAASNSVPIPRSTYEQYKAIFPDWTDSRIREHWNKVQD